MTSKLNYLIIFSILPILSEISISKEQANFAQVSNEVRSMVSDGLDLQFFLLASSSHSAATILMESSSHLTITSTSSTDAFEGAMPSSDTSSIGQENIIDLSVSQSDTERLFPDTLESEESLANSYAHAGTLASGTIGRVDSPINAGNGTYSASVTDQVKSSAEASFVTESEGLTQSPLPVIEKSDWALPADPSITASTASSSLDHITPVASGIFSDSSSPTPAAAGATGGGTASDSSSAVVQNLEKAAGDISLRYPTHDTVTGNNVFDIGVRSISASTTSHWGYDIQMAGTTTLDRITGTFNASVGTGGSDVSYISWEIVRMDGSITQNTDYNWILDLDINVSSYPGQMTDSVYCLILHHYNAGAKNYRFIKEVAGTIDITDYRALSENTNPAAYGVEVGAYFSVEELSTQVNISDSDAGVGYQFKTGARVGIDKAGKIIAGKGITGDITITNTTEATGMLFVGTGDANVAADQPLMGYISSNIRITSDESSPVKAAVGIYVNGAGNGNDLDGELTGVFNGNIDIDVVYDAETSIYTSPAVTGIHIVQNDSLVNEDGLITFGDGASISAKYTIEGTSEQHLGSSVSLDASRAQNQFRLTTEKDTDTVYLEGDIRSYFGSGSSRVAHDLTFEHGTFVVTANEIEASSITLGRIDEVTGEMVDAKLNLTQSTSASSVSSLDFFVQGGAHGEHSEISIDVGAQLTLDNLNEINIFLNEDLLDYSQFRIDLVNGDIQGLAEGGIINIMSSTSNTPLWTIDMVNGYHTYLLEGEHAGQLELIYNEDGITLIARIPEPTSSSLIILGISALIFRRRRTD